MVFVVETVPLGEDHWTFWPRPQLPIERFCSSDFRVKNICRVALP